jgi:hypothetical protein
MLGPALACPGCGRTIHFAGSGLILEPAHRGSYRIDSRGSVDRVKDGAGSLNLHTCPKRGPR